MSVDLVKKLNLPGKPPPSTLSLKGISGAGDYVVVKKQRTAHPGQMVVAQTPDGEATLKYWHPEANRIRLQPANSSMSPIYVKEASVLGVVIGVVRNMN